MARRRRAAFAAYPERPRSPSARLVQKRGARRSAAQSRSTRSALCLRGGLARMQRSRQLPWARISTPNRPAASSTACSASRRARSDADAAEDRLRNQRSDRDRQLDEMKKARVTRLPCLPGVSAEVFTPEFAHSRARPRWQNLRRGTESASATKAPKNPRHENRRHVDLHMEQGRSWKTRAA